MQRPDTHEHRTTTFGTILEAEAFQEGITCVGDNYISPRIHELSDPTGFIVEFDTSDNYDACNACAPGPRWIPPDKAFLNLAIHPMALEALNKLLNKNLRDSGISASEFVMRAVRMWSKYCAECTFELDNRLHIPAKSCGDMCRNASEHHDFIVSATPEDND